MVFNLINKSYLIFLELFLFQFSPQIQKTASEMNKCLLNSQAHSDQIWSIPIKACGHID